LRAVAGGNQPSECPQSAGKELAWRDLASATAFSFVFVLQQAAPGAACFSCPRIEVRVTMNRAAHDPNVRTAGATGGKADRGKSADDNK